MLTIPLPNACMSAILSNETLPPGLVWIRGQLERGELRGLEHYQVVCAFESKVALPGVVRLYGDRVHAELSRSEAANDYVWKEETRIGTPFEFGAKPIRVNSAVDYQGVWDAAKQGDLDRIPPRVRVVSYRTIRAIASDFSVPKAFERNVRVFWGPTATGKSRRAWSEAGSGAYSKCPRSKFWDGYQGQSEVVIDEFRGSVDVSYLLRWFDRYPVRVDIKGSSVPLVAPNVWITSNLAPIEWYPGLDQDTLAALLRRLEVTHFN